MSFHVFFFSLHCFNLLVFSLRVDWDVFILIILPIGCPIPLSVMCNTAPRACSLSYVYTCIYRICIYRIYIYIYNLFSTIFFFISTIYILGSRATRREDRMNRCDELIHIWKTITKFNDNRFNRDLTVISRRFFSLSLSLFFLNSFLRRSEDKLFPSSRFVIVYHKM